MSRSKRRSIAVKQTKQVQGPQLLNRPPETANVQLNATLNEKYLGTGLIGFGPYLEVLSNLNVNDLVCKHGYALFRKMLQDDEVDASLDALIQASSSAIIVVPSVLEDDPGYILSKELAEFVNWVFAQFDIDNWRKSQLLYALAFGNSVSEIDWDVIETGKWADHLAITGLRQSEPENYGFITDRYGTIYGVAPLNTANMLFPLGSLIPLSANTTKILEGAVPAFKLTIWTWEKRGNDPRGNGMLVPAYIPWWSKQRAIEEWACWVGRYAQPSIWATPGPDALPICITAANGHQTFKQPTEALLEALVQFKSASVLALPYGSELNMLSATGGSEPFFKSIEAFNMAITRAITGQHLATSEGSTQGKTGSELHSLVLRMLIAGIKKFAIDRIQRDLIEPLIEANYGDVGYLMPTIDISSNSFPLTPTEIAVLFQSGFFTEDQLPIIDKQLGLPIRTTTNRVGPANLPQEMNNGSNNPSD